MDVYYQDEFHTIRSDSNCIRYKAIAEARDSEHFRSGLLKIAELLSQDNLSARKISSLADVREIQTLPLRDSIWVNEVFIPMLFNRGVRNVALVVARDIFPQLALDHMAMGNVKVHKSCSIGIFDNMEDAENWLKKNEL